MLDIKLIRDEPETVKNNLKKRIGFDITIVDEVLEIDKEWRERKKELDDLKAKKNKESKNIAEVKKSGGDIKTQISKVKEISDMIENKKKEVNDIEERRNVKLSKIPNMLDEEVPVGEDDEENVEIKTYGNKKEFNFKIKNHQELCELNDWYDLETAAKHSGSRFYYMKNELVLLEVALYNYVLNKLMNKGYMPVEVPPMLRRESATRAIPLSDFEDTIYKVPTDEGHELFLIGTSEHALAVIHADEIINHKNLPIKYAGLSPCFRREAGVTKDEKGIFRVHNFNKIEQFVYSKPEDSEKILEEITQNAEEIFQELGVHYRIVEICSGDIGIFAARKYDLEAWLPGQQNYREMVSASNYREYGARRMGTRYQDEKNEIKYLHTLNSTAIALQRTLIAIIETHQTKDGNVKIPEVLRPYFGERELLKKN